MVRHAIRAGTFPTISVFYGVVIQMFAGDHPPPHFHALYAKHEALIDLRNLGVFRGSFAQSAGPRFGMGGGTSQRVDGGLGAMQPTTESETDRAIAVEPAIEPRAAWRVRQVFVVEHGLLDVTFVDDTRGMVDLRLRMRRADIAETVFGPLCDPTLFARVAIRLGTIEWPGDIDLAPDAMYDSIRAEGRWILN